jgi:hypothetical protein
VQLRRVLLLFALVLGLSALVASIVPPPEERADEASPAVERPSSRPRASGPSDAVRVDVAADPRRDRLETWRAAVGSRVSVEVSVRSPGDITLGGLGLRQSADPLAPARFDLLAARTGRHPIVFVPIRGRARVVGRLAFAEPATVKPRAPAR